MWTRKTLPSALDLGIFLKFYINNWSCWSENLETSTYICDLETEVSTLLILFSFLFSKNGKILKALRTLK